MGKNLSSKCKEYKEILLAIIEELHLKAKVQPLTASERDAVLDENERVISLDVMRIPNGLNGLSLNMFKKEE
jgi:hypothetical protein